MPPIEKKCNFCGRTKPLNQYHRRKDMKDGHQATCKMCMIARQKMRQKGLTPPPPEDRTIKYTGLTKSDWCKMYKWMQKLGYDITKDLHLQFCERHGLPPKPKPKKNLKKYYPHECEDNIEK